VKAPTSTERNELAKTIAEAPLPWRWHFGIVCEACNVCNAFEITDEQARGGKRDATELLRELDPVAQKRFCLFWLQHEPHGARPVVAQFAELPAS
jgi:hypothetical protein